MRDLEPPPAGAPAAARLVAFFEVLLCSGFPTQLAIGGTFLAFGQGAFNPSGALSLRYVVGLSLIDSVVVCALIVLFLLVHGERPRDVLVGNVAVAREAAAGVPMIFVALAIAMTVILASRLAAPWLHTVAENPLQGLLKSPRDAALFALVVIVAGGVREELQRAFALHRFDVWLGGGTTGVVVTSVAFGAGHLIQGADAAVATGLLGAFWAVVYLRRRSAVAPMVSHAGFDLLQIAAFLAARHS
jgi:membrane protease YdiL (CAAX protease family)